MASTGQILVLNTGSSSIKFSLYESGAADLLLKGLVENLQTGPTRFLVQDAAHDTVHEQSWPQALDHAAGMQALLAFLDSSSRSGGGGGDQGLRAVGHRIVHGGALYSGPVRVSEAVLAELDKLVPLAPLHLPHNLAAVRAAMQMAPGVMQVACFDTAFHRSQPALAQAFALPPEITELGIHRYGFHGLSYEYIASRLPQAEPALAGARVVAAHLGNGASMCAMHAGRSVASSMGFTAIDGLPMGTRCGALDPGVVLYLIDQLGMDVAAVQDLLYLQSGLLGVSGISSDMRTLEASEAPRAQLAIDLMVYRIGRELGSMAAALGGIDALVFSGGIGENSVALRAAVCRAADWLGVQIDAQANAAPGKSVVRISAAASAVSVWVVPANEELMIARHTLDIVEQS
ncbi:acetate/propionate family kinase [Massilia sp. H6]|uniref:acetate/propionate family kinase n=1 Tax=Massilia sp. H6 TaxID=2970464 RepID=UPI002169BB4A|nr:acetate/propionate family kinase [Massilia sp. H6]UVW30342.1 acetate/propionate family kinase [Massilia sp. H6]